MLLRNRKTKRTTVWNQKRNGGVPGAAGTLFCGAICVNVSEAVGVVESVTMQRHDPGKMPLCEEEAEKRTHALAAFVLSVTGGSLHTLEGLSVCVNRCGSTPGGKTHHGHVVEY